MNKSVPSPRFENGRLILITGLQQHHTQKSAAAGIPAQWTKFMQTVSDLPERVGTTSYGVVINATPTAMDYVCGVEVSNFSNVTSEYARLNLPSARYAVFSIKEHISAIQSAWASVWNTWFPTSNYAVTNGPLFEKYDERFNPKTGLGGYELWVPVVEKR